MLLQDVLIGFAFYLIIEGLVYALAPSLIDRMLVALAAFPPEARRLMGLLALISGLALVWAAKALGA